MKKKSHVIKLPNIYIYTWNTIKRREKRGKNMQRDNGCECSKTKERIQIIDPEHLRILN